MSAGENSRRFDFKLVKAAPEGAGDFAKGVEAYNQGDNAAAAAAFEAAMAKAPDLPEIRVNLALAYFKLQRTADAVAQLEKAAALAPNNQARAVPARRRLRRDAVARQGDGGVREGARDQVGRQRSAGLGSDRRRSARCTSPRARPTRRPRSIEKALAAKPGAPAPTLGLGKVYFSKNDVAKALQLFEQVAAQKGTPEAAEAEVFIKELKKQ